MPPRTETERERLRRISILNARLPRKRTIAQGVLRDPEGRVLLCELSYKKEWDLPGGVVDPGESPATCVEREIRGGARHRGPVRAAAGGQLAPAMAWLGRRAALPLRPRRCTTTGELDPSLFLRREIAGAHWRTVAEAASHVAPYTARMLEVAQRTPSTRHTSRTASRRGPEPARRRVELVHRRAGRLSASWHFKSESSGLPNVGKSTMFNALTKNNVLAANYPFATIDPNVGVVPLPDERLGAARRDLRLARRSSRPPSPSSTSPASCAARPRGRGWATSSSPTSARPTRSARSSAPSRTATSCTSTARSRRARTSRRSTPS